jgi:hypothetical protein
MTMIAEQIAEVLKGRFSMISDVCAQEVAEEIITKIGLEPEELLVQAQVNRDVIEAIRWITPLREKRTKPL